MSTIIYPSPVFGPVHSRRLGVSLGINLLPEDGKFCTFDCVYCECGFNKDHRPHRPLPTREEVYTVLEERLKDMHENGPRPDVLTFAGNGEPTLHPEFAGIIEDVVRLRNHYFPEAKISVLSNATQVLKPEVFNALLKVDNNIQKLDTVNPAYIELVDRPTGHYDVQQIIDQLKAFSGHVIIQTMFMTGSTQGKSVDNTTPEFVEPWLKVVQEIKPRQVMIYTIDRETPDHDLRKAEKEVLDRIGEQVREAGFEVSVSY
jgi:wyosine [tRNA(Phe)-imidazoG37] synthetase (radical SAM superfamily)